MYAVIATGGKQYRIAEGDTLKVEKLDGEVGSNITFDEVLLFTDADGKTEVGTPHLANVEVTGEIVKQDRLKKINILKFKRRKQHMKQMGHRQSYTAVKITKIGVKKTTVKKATKEK